MAYDRQHLYITGTGQIGTGGGAGEEIFSFGVRASGVSTAFNAVTALAELDVGAVAAIFGTYFTAANTHINADAHLFRVKVAAVGVDGLYLSAPVEAEPSPGGVSGAGSSVRHPNQVAIAVSTGATTTIGRATHGRFYLPLPDMIVGVEGRINSTARGHLLGTSVIFLDSLNTQLDLDISQNVQLRIMSNVGAGASNPITLVRVGDVLDTIRARRNALEESYAVGAVA